MRILTNIQEKGLTPFLIGQNPCSKLHKKLLPVYAHHLFGILLAMRIFSRKIILLGWIPDIESLMVGRPEFFYDSRKQIIDKVFLCAKIIIYKMNKLLSINKFNSIATFESKKVNMQQAQNKNTAYKYLHIFIFTYRSVAIFKIVSVLQSLRINNVS